MESELAKLLNRPMMTEDISWVLRQPENDEIIKMVQAYADEGLPLFNGSLRCSNMVYDRDQFRLVHWLRMWEYLSVFQLAVNKAPEGEMLDCGGAGSLFPFWLAERGFSLKVVDLQEFTTEISMAVAKSRGLGNLEFVTGDITALSFPEGKFDVVYSISVLEHLKPAVRVNALKEMARVLKDDGVIALTFDFGGENKNADNPGDGRYAISDLNQVRSEVNSAGLVIQGNDIDRQMEKYKDLRPSKEEFEIRYQLLTRRLGPDVSWKDLISYMITLLSYKTSAKFSYALTRQKMTGDYNFFRLFLKKS